MVLVPTGTPAGKSLMASLVMVLGAAKLTMLALSPKGMMCWGLLNPGDTAWIRSSLLTATEEKVQPPFVMTKRIGTLGPINGGVRSLQITVCELVAVKP